MMRDSSSSSSSNATSLTKRLETIFKKASELSILCEIEVCVIHYGADGELKTWPEERETVKGMALRYKEAKKRKKSFNIHQFIDQEKKDESEKKKKKQKKQKNNVKFRDWYPIFDHYSIHQLSQLVQSLEQTLSKLHERIRVVESQRQKIHHDEYDQTQALNHPSKFSLYMYNHGDSTLSQFPISASHSNQLYQNHLMQQNQLFGFDQNIFNRNVLGLPCVSSKQPYSPLESAVNNYGLNHCLMQQEEQNMYVMSEFTKSNVLQHHHSLSNTVPNEFSYDPQQNPNGDGASITSFSQDIFSSYNDNSLLQTSSLPSLHTTLNSFCLSNKSTFLS